MEPIVFDCEEKACEALAKAIACFRRGIPREIVIRPFSESPFVGQIANEKTYDLSVVEYLDVVKSRASLRERVLSAANDLGLQLSQRPKLHLVTWSDGNGSRQEEVFTSKASAMDCVDRLSSEGVFAMHRKIHWRDSRAMTHILKSAAGCGQQKLDDTLRRAREAVDQADRTNCGKEARSALTGADLARAAR